jgi:hypothetical protein
MGDVGQSASAGVDVNDLVPFMGCCCFITSCYTQWPDMVGCSGKDECLCMKREFLACKFPREPDTWWLCGTGKGVLAPPKVLCMVLFIIFSMMFLAFFFNFFKPSYFITASVPSLLFRCPCISSLHWWHPLHGHHLLLHSKTSWCSLLFFFIIIFFSFFLPIFFIFFSVVL